MEFRDHEVVVIDAGNIAGLESLVAIETGEAQIAAVRAELPVAAQLNLGVAAASGRYVTFLDPGDSWHSRYLSYQQAVFEAAPDALYSRTGCCRRGLIGNAFLPNPPRPISAPDPVLAMLVQADLPARSSFAVPRSLFMRSGGFDEHAGRFANFDLALRLLGGLRKGGRLACEEHPAPYVPQVLAMTETDVDIADLAGGMEGWYRDLQSYLGRLFDYPFMERFREHRKWFEARLIEERCDLLKGVETESAAA
ncbi:MAG: glycosyltransferase family A protein [Rhodospirillaceae bacterium]|nr:glycosyltransferase family A protein [Rhodospirillaceae bacterium]